MTSTSKGKRAYFALNFLVRLSSPHNCLSVAHRYGVIAEAEVSGWRAFTPENSYLVVASDGVFETLTPKDVCRLLHKTASSPLPERLIRHAFETGSMDNLSAIVISCYRGRCGRERTESQPFITSI